MLYLYIITLFTTMFITIPFPVSMIIIMLHQSQPIIAFIDCTFSQNEHWDVLISIVLDFLPIECHVVSDDMLLSDIYIEACKFVQTETHNDVAVLTANS